MSPRRLLRCLAAAVASAAGAPAHAAAPAGAPDGTIELPPLSVVVSKTTRPWQYLELPGVEILSHCADNTTRDFAQSHHRLVQLLRLVLPAEFQVQSTMPAVIILSNDELVAAASRDTVAGPRPAEERDARGRPINIRYMPNLSLEDRDSSCLFAIVNERAFDGDRMYFTASHVRFLLERRVPPLPAWLKEGILGLVPDLAFRADFVELGPAEWTAAETYRLKQDRDYPHTLLPMHELLVNEAPVAGDAATREAARAPVLLEVQVPNSLAPRYPGGDAAEVQRVWKAQATLFVRWALDGENAPRRAALWRFVGRACAEPVTEEMFRDCFGFGYADARDRLSDYLPVALNHTIRLRAERLTRLPAVKLRDATPAEIGRLKGDWERLEIGFVRARHPEFVPQYQEQAHRTLAQAFEADPDDPRLLAVIGLYEIEVRNDAAARSYLEVGARAKVVRPRLYFELARLRYAEALANAAGRDGRLSVAQVNTVLQPLSTGCAQLPPLGENFLLAAEAWGRSDAALEGRHFALLDEGLRLFPQHPALLYRVAALNAMQGRPVEAAALVERGLRVAQPGVVRASLLKLQAALAAAAKAKPK